MTPRPRVVILAAGRGSRFGPDQHKSLAPVDNQGGTLARLLRQLAADPHAGDVTVVVGAHAERVARTARNIVADVHLVANDRFAESGPAGSLAAAMRDLRPGPLWTLLADTVYREDFLDAMWSAPVDGAAVAVMRPRQPREFPVTDSDVPVVVRQGHVMALGPDHPRDFEMAPAVRWPAEHWPLVLAGAHHPTQWRIIDQALTKGTIDAPHAVEVPADSYFDVDTHADLRDARRRLSKC